MDRQEEEKETFEEEEITTLRPHSIFIIYPILAALLSLGLVGLIFYHYGASFIFSLVFFLWLIFGGGFAFIRWYRWYMSRYTVTNKRIVIKQQAGFLKRLTSEIKIEDITDITSEVEGLWGTLFNYGNLYLESQGREPLLLKDLYNPTQLQKELLQLRDEILENKKVSAEDLIKTVGKDENTKNTIR